LDPFILIFFCANIRINVLTKERRIEEKKERRIEKLTFWCSFLFWVEAFDLK
jgi:hypothetical protein